MVFRFVEMGPCKIKANMPYHLELNTEESASCILAHLTGDDFAEARRFIRARIQSGHYTVVIRD